MSGAANGEWRLALKVAGAVVVAGTVPLMGLVLTMAEWKGAIDVRLGTVETASVELRRSREEFSDSMRDLTIAVKLNSAQMAALIARIDRRRSEQQQRGNER